MRPGAFQIIRDEKTKLWRAVRPDPNDITRLDPYDEAYQEKWRDAPPLLPARFIRSVSMYKKSEGLPFFLELTTGWKVWFYSSDGEPSQGEHYNGAWIDEDISNYDHLKEIQRGLVGLQEKPKHRPKMFWTATGQSSNPQLVDLRENAERGVPGYAAFKTTICQNPYIPEEEKESFAAGLSESERRVRVYGEHALKARRAYPAFDATGPHGYDPFPIPPDWTRYLIIDPGSMFQGILAVAIDPNEEYLSVYDGILLRNADANGVARWVQQQEGPFELCVLDWRAGRQRQMGMEIGSRVSLLYKKALDEAGISFRQVGPMDGFFPGSQDVAARQESLRTMMDPRVSGPYAGTAKFRVARGMLPELEDQIRHAQMDPKNPDKRLKAAWREFQEDLLVCAEYIAAFDPRYFEPASVNVDPGSGMVDQFRAFQQRKRRKQATSDSYR